jgi:hypothetical protein
LSFQRFDLVEKLARYRCPRRTRWPVLALIVVCHIVDDGVPAGWRKAYANAELFGCDGWPAFSGGS